MKIFSLPLNPKLDQNQFNDFIQFTSSHKHLIKDIYFTSRIAPFNQDAMGDVFVLQEHDEYIIENALNIQNITGVPVSATFNNIYVRPTQQNLDLWIKNFRPLYESGIRVCTLPHTHWMATGQVKKQFPDLYVKNTILRDVNSASEIVALAKAGFDYINLDRDLMRDRETLVRLKQAKEWVQENLGKTLSFSLLANEGCIGNCPMMEEHFHFNCTRDKQSPQYFNDPISRVSCPKWDAQDPAVQLKTANLPPWKKDWEEFFDLGIDVFKLHGRESISRLYESMRIIYRWNNNEEILMDGFENYINENNLIEKPINVWREKIKNCKFDCWECQFCDKIYKSKSKNFNTKLINHVVESIADSGNIKYTTEVEGLTSKKVQSLLASIASECDNYLEIGSFIGSSATAVLQSNIKQMYCVDLWEEQIKPNREDILVPENSLETFKNNIKKYKKDTKVNFFKCDLFNVDLNEINDIDLFFYDGPHDYETTKRSVQYYSKKFANECVLVFDDANWKGVVDGAKEGITSSGLTINYEKIMLNSEEDPEQYWNGLFVAVVSRI